MENQGSLHMSLKATTKGKFVRGTSKVHPRAGRKAETARNTLSCAHGQRWYASAAVSVWAPCASWEPAAHSQEAVPALFHSNS